ncbi:PAN domain-containing protein At5g03700 isoform X1 [Magnolia sinica]|uniref:PAN domain-containing protein At5g03700 isoform X1 n=1 Tax=Magnolia sinica TaxID=86752 RepID=UPI0026590599|nr:PAN domain-containing protein At5g03700 isoform X1 [Magnolia sinica]
MGVLTGILFHLLLHGLCDSHLSIGNQIIVPVPRKYDPSFLQGKAFFIHAGETVPDFKAALSVDTFDGKYLCELAVFLGEQKVWNSGRFSHFYPTGSCVLELLETGVLQLSDTSGRIGWRIGSYGQGVKMLQLQRTGNLILIDIENNTKWQSFDFPADIILWHQRLYAPAQLTSFSANSASYYSLQIRHDKIAMYLYSNSRNYSYWEFKPNKNRSISFAELGSKGLKLFNSQYHKIAQVPTNGQEPIRFLALSKTGNLRFYYYSPHSGKFEASFQLLNSTCDLPLTCGPYGICSSSSTCTCMGFSKWPKRVQSECDEAFSAGFCGSGDATKMVQLLGVTSVLRGIPQNVNVSKEECVSLCTEDCTCSAVLFSNSSNQQECFLYELVGGVKEVEKEIGMSYLVKVPKETNANCGSCFSIRKLLLLLGGVVDGVAVVLIFGGLVFYFLKKKRGKDMTSENT